MMDCFVIIVF